MRFDLFNQINQDIPRSLCSTKRKYTFNIDVSFDVFNTFITFWETDIFPEDQITIDNIDEFEEFYDEVGLDIIKQKIKSRREQFNVPEINLSNLRNPRIANKSNIEESIAKDLDNYIINYSEALFKLPIHSLYNIFNHKERKLTQFNQFYELIISIAAQTQNFDLYILLPSINIEDLNDKNQNNSILSSEQRFGFKPKISNNNFFNRNDSTINLLKISNNQKKLQLQEKDQTISQFQIEIQSKDQIISQISDKNRSMDQENLQLRKQCDLNDYLLYESNRLTNILLPHISSFNNIPVDEIIPYLIELKNYEFITYIIQHNLFDDINRRIMIKNPQREYQTSLLCFSIENGNIDLLRLLLEQPRIDVNISIERFDYFKNSRSSRKT